MSDIRLAFNTLFNNIFFLFYNIFLFNNIFLFYNIFLFAKIFGVISLECLLTCSYLRLINHELTKKISGKLDQIF